MEENKKNEIKQEINNCYEEQFAKIAYYYENGIMPEGIMKVKDLVGLVANITNNSYQLVKDSIKDLKFKEDEERIIINQERYESIKSQLDKFPPTDLSNPETLDNLEKTKEALDNMIAKGDFDISFKDGQFDMEEFTEKMQEQISKMFSENDEFADFGEPEIIVTEVDAKKSGFSPEDKVSGQRVIVSKKKKSKPKRAIDEFGTNLNELAKVGKIDKVIGREKEINRVIEILNRRSKNNPCLVGEPGVGKTAIAQGLALKIVNKEVPYKLQNKEVYLLDMGAVVAGTQFRGQFEARIKMIMNECRENENIILVIDELHTIMGSGDTENSTNAANILKPALSRGEVQIIGTTTLNEYRKYIEKDSALERRFQMVIVDEPSIEDSIKMIEGIKEYFEDFHKVVISKEMVEKAVIMSEKYVHSRFLPDKAIDIIDEACSRINLDNTKLHELEVLKNELKKVQEEKEECISSDSTESYKMAAEFKQKECQIQEQIEELNKQIVPIALKLEDIARVIERWTKIPVAKITQEELDKLINLESNIQKRVIGQEKAVVAVSKAIRRNRAGLQTIKRPPSFIFVGPTGVGKTELAKTVAAEMFGNENNIIRVDMSEYMEKYSVSKMVGSAPGYVGYDEGGHLTEKVRRNPYSIVLFDEIEKAHPDVFNLLLQVLDDGRLTDSQGRVVNFENTIIIMTSNAGSNINTNTIGFGTDQEKRESKVNEALKQHFRPEFLNRIDEIVIFESLKEDELVQIVDIFLNNTNKALKNKEIALEVTNNAKKYIVAKGTDLKYGARPLRRAIQKEVEDNIADMILRKEVESGQIIIIDTNKDKTKLVFKVK